MDSERFKNGVTFQDFLNKICSIAISSCQKARSNLAEVGHTNMLDEDEEQKIQDFILNFSGKMNYEPMDAANAIMYLRNHDTYQFMFEWFLRPALMNKSYNLSSDECNELFDNPAMFIYTLKREVEGE